MLNSKNFTISFNSYVPKTIRQDKEYVEKDLSGLLLDILDNFNIELVNQNWLNAVIETVGDIHEDPVVKIHITGRLNNLNIRVDSHSRDVFAAINKLEEPFTKQLRRGKNKRMDKKRNSKREAKRSLYEQAEAGYEAMITTSEEAC